MTTSIIFIGLAVLFVLAKIILEKRLAHLDAAGDERRLGDLSFSLGCSVYDLFVQAGTTWDFSKAKIEADFKDYVLHDQIPPYLHDYLQKNGLSGNQTYQELLYSGGRPPYL
ncbi:MAG: hypothetical protein JJV98_21365 [Desulfosarcina sp.]|nr:hypothetical protein [Desulfobacterales bacterium]